MARKKSRITEQKLFRIEENTYTKCLFIKPVKVFGIVTSSSYLNEN